MIAKIILWIAATGFVLVLTSCISVVLNVIPWVLYNFALAPALGWPHAGFWTVFLICWAIGFFGFLGKLIFSGLKKS